MSDKPTDPTTHNESVAAAAVRFKAIAQAANRGVLRSGLTLDERKRIVAHLRDGRIWRDAYRLSVQGLVDPQSIEAWKVELEKQAAEPDQRIQYK